jgi:hypothetical protein
MIQDTTNRTEVSLKITWTALLHCYFLNILNTDLSLLGKPADVLRSTCNSFSTKDKLKHAGNNGTNKNYDKLILQAGFVLNIAV